MFYSLISVLYPIWILLQQKNTAIYNNNLKSVITSTDLDKTVVDTDTHSDDKLVFIKKRLNEYDGFDLTKNDSFVGEENTELRKIANYFRKLKQLKILNSPVISHECKLKCALEVLEEAKEEKETYKIKKNDFWETYDDMFF